MIDYMIADLINNKELNPVITKIFIKSKKINISIVFITHSYLNVTVTKEVRLNTTQFFATKITNKRELQQIALKHSSDNDLKIS